MAEWYILNLKNTITNIAQIINGEGEDLALGQTSTYLT